VQVFLTFSFYQISQDKHGDNSVYFSLISGIVGYLLPAPQLQENHHKLILKKKINKKKT
jgi:hypothetical protein